MSLTNNVTEQNTQQLDFDVDFDDDYDSTWEDENKTVRRTKNSLRKFSNVSRNVYAARDMQEFRHSCKNLDDVDEPENQRTTYWEESNMEHRKENFYNLEFYTGFRTSEPDDTLIDQFHKEWRGKYAKLERVHSYIQWLFPIQEQGMNWQAHVLTKQEIKLFRKDNKAKQNLVKSYELMLDFYGIRLVSKETGDVEHADNWEERFDNMNRNTHNNLRITRILKCLGTLGFKHYQEKLVKFFLHETLVEKRLPNIKKSVLDYFMFAVLDKSQRQDLVRFAFRNFRPQKDFVWGPKKILLAGEFRHEMTIETGIPASKASEENRTLEEESSRMQEGSMMPSSTTINTAEDSERDRSRQEPKTIMLNTENESIASGINKTLDKEYSRTQEEGVTPDYPTSHTAKDTGRDRNRQELVLDHAENEATKSGEKITLNGEPIRKQETGEILSTLTSNPAEDAREGSEQIVKSSQSNFAVQHDQDGSHCATEMEDITAEQSDTKDQMQGMQITESDMIVEQTSNESDEISQNRREVHQVGSDSAEGGEKNGCDYVKWVTQV